MPLSAEATHEKFKIYFVDIGLCLRILGVPLVQAFLEKNQIFVNRGGLAEQLVAQEFLSLTPKNQTPALHYWHRESKSSQAEVDFVIEKDAQVIPVEVKSGHDGSMKSLHLFMQEKSVRNGIKISAYPYSVGVSGDKEIRTIPFYGIRGALANRT